MKDYTNWIKGALIALSLSFIITACDIVVKAIRPEPVDLMQTVCEGIGSEFGTTAEADCQLLETPTVVYTEKLTDYFGTYGFYLPGEPYVYVMPDLDFERTIVEHETVHYVVDELDLMDVNDLCEMERVARKLSPGDEDEWNDETKSQYGCD